jgi:hypothetical protein
VRTIPSLTRPAWLPWLALAAGVCVMLLPLAYEASRVWSSGDYVTQRYSWRSAPSGIDAASLVLGNPTSVWLGSIVRPIYASLKIEPVESAAWMGVVPIALILLSLRTRGDGHAASSPTSHVRRWLIVLACFGIWSLGPYLVAFGVNSGLMLPQIFVRYVPIVSNARMPGRAFTLVMLATAMIGATMIASHPMFERRRVLRYLAIALVVIDFWPAPFPVAAFDTPALYATLASQPRAVLLELPMGVRDGFGEIGWLDHASLMHQMVHRDPIAGGFVARLPDRIKKAYETDAVFGPLLALSEPADARIDRRVLDPPDKSLACVVRYVAMPKAIAGASAAALAAFAREVFVLRLLTENGDRELYAVDGFRPPYCAGGVGAAGVAGAGVAGASGVTGGSAGRGT